MDEREYDERYGGVDWGRSVSHWPSGTICVKCKKPLGSWTSLILCRLTDDDFDRFHAGKVTFSGSTGKGARSDDYWGVGPYIATFMFNMEKALTAMGWTEVRLELVSDKQILVFNLQSNRDVRRQPVRAIKLEGS